MPMTANAQSAKNSATYIGPLRCAVCLFSSSSVFILVAADQLCITQSVEHRRQSHSLKSVSKNFVCTRAYASTAMHRSTFPYASDNFWLLETWCRRRDLNPRPPAYEADALPLSYAGTGRNRRNAPVLTAGAIVGKQPGAAPATPT